MRVFNVFPPCPCHPIWLQWWVTHGVLDLQLEMQQASNEVSLDSRISHLRWVLHRDWILEICHPNYKWQKGTQEFHELRVWNKKAVNFTVIRSHNPLGVKQKFPIIFWYFLSWTKKNNETPSTGRWTLYLQSPLAVPPAIQFLSFWPLEVPCGTYFFPKNMLGFMNHQFLLLRAFIIIQKGLPHQYLIWLLTSKMIFILYWSPPTFLSEYPLRACPNTRMSCSFVQLGLAEIDCDPLKLNW